MSELGRTLEREILPLVSRPSRYTGVERNVCRKPLDDARLTFLLAFPDVYEIGMSHLGIRVLHDILNRRPDVAAERVFAPWIDMERLMRERGVPLFSIESRRPARDFDVIGFTLQYELHYAEVLAMLDLAGIPLRADRRGPDDPLVIGGGPCAMNPEPLAPFFDLFVIGDGESAVLDLADTLIAARADGASRKETLARLAGISGVYVPSLYEARYEAGRFAGTARVDPRAPARVLRRVEDRLTRSSHPARPIVPASETTHDRLALEIMRGCTRGCRFCQAGMITRPVRERAVEDIVWLAEEGIRSSGYDEVSLVSLSASDYSDLPRLVARLNEALFDRRVSISLPSLRTDRFGLEVADGIGRVRRAGLTFAPEAGTQRLRDVINKNETEENIIDTVEVAFSSGWSRVKLYFMIGLPTETEEDVAAIAGLVRRVRDAARRVRKGAALTVSVSPFVPKPHTPFQWERQDRAGETRAKEDALKPLLRMKGVKVALRDPEVSVLEGALARGDRRLANVVEAAWRRGARLDGWTEHFDASLWSAAFADAGVDEESCLGPFGPDAPLPWDHIDGGPSRSFLFAEWRRALAGETTPDCRESGCFDCGACGPEERASREMLRDGAVVAVSRPAPRRRRRRAPEGGVFRYRVRYAKGPAARFLSHLDLVRAWSRALAESDLPIIYTQGFNPRPRVSFGPPLPVGTTGEAEVVEIDLGRPTEPAEIVRRLATATPEGIDVLAASAVAARASAAAQAEAAEYVITGFGGPAGPPPDELDARIAHLRSIDEARIPRGESTRTVRPRESILSVSVLAGPPPVLKVVLALGCQGALRPIDLLRLLWTAGNEPPELARIHRSALLVRTAPGRLEEVA
jgi:radical SAM family uncharacterized protein/radical SAM-linked protein